MRAFLNLGFLVALNFGLSYKRYNCKCIGYWLFMVRLWQTFLKILCTLCIVKNPLIRKQGICTIFCKFVYVWIMWVLCRKPFDYFNHLMMHYFSLWIYPKKKLKSMWVPLPYSKETTIYSYWTHMINHFALGWSS